MQSSNDEPVNNWHYEDEYIDDDIELTPRHNNE